MRFTQLILYVAFKSTALFLSFTPRRFSYFCGRLMGRLSFRFLAERKKITLKNLRYAFAEKDITWRYNTALKVFENYGLNLVKFFRFALNPRSLNVKSEGLERLKDNSPKVILGCHLGNWEIAGMAAAASGVGIYPIAKRIHTPASEKLVNKIRFTYGGRVISDRGGVRAVLRKLREKKKVYILFDQRIKKGIPVKFFNRPVWGTHITSLLHKRTGVDIIPCWSRSGEDKVEVFYEKPFKMVAEGDPVRADFINTQNQFNWLEDRIRTDPAQWYWVHDMWKPRRKKRGWNTVFLDRDGTLIKDKGYVYKKEDLEFFPGVFETLRNLRKAGYLLILLTNQSGIARGYYSGADYRKFNSYFLNRLFEEGVIVDRVYHCPHHPDDGCSCRKPQTGMIEKAMNDIRISLSRSFMVGDKPSDIMTGKKMGIRTVGLGEKSFEEAQPDFKVSTIKEAGRVILEKGL